MRSFRDPFPAKTFLLASLLFSGPSLAAFTPEENQAAISGIASAFASQGKDCLPAPVIPQSVSADALKDLQRELHSFLACNSSALSDIRFRKASKDAIAKLFAPASPAQKSALLDLWDREAAKATIRVESSQTEILRRYGKAISHLDSDDKKSRIADLESKMSILTSCASRYRSLISDIAEVDRLAADSQARTDQVQDWRDTLKRNRSSYDPDSYHDEVNRLNSYIREANKRGSILQSKHNAAQAASDRYRSDCQNLASNQPMRNTLCSDSDNAKFCSEYRMSVDPDSDNFETMMINQRSDRASLEQGEFRKWGTKTLDFDFDTGL